MRTTPTTRKLKLHKGGISGGKSRLTKRKVTDTASASATNELAMWTITAARGLAARGARVRVALPIPTQAQVLQQDLADRSSSRKGFFAKPPLTRRLFCSITSFEGNVIDCPR